MKLVTAQEVSKRRPNKENGPTISVYFGGEGDSADIGVIKITVPPSGGGMAPHKHNGSDIVISPLSGSVVIAKEDESLEVKVGDSILILRDELVSLSNNNAEEAVVLVSAGPADFISKGVLSMPEA